MPRIHKTKHYIRHRLISPKKFQKGSFRTITPNIRTRIVIGRLKGKTTTTAQSILKRRKYKHTKHYRKRRRTFVESLYQPNLRF